MVTFLKLILVLVILAAMIILLLGLNHVFTGKFDMDNSDTARLRQDVERNRDVISRDNIFNPLVQHSTHVQPDRRYLKRNR